MTKFFEDIEVGATARAGRITVTEPDIVEFAEQFDPQPFHTDPEAAAEYMWGELIASGWHTASLCHRLGVDAIESEDWADGIGMGVTDLEWPRPVFAGDSIATEIEVVETERTRRKPEYGKVTTRYVGRNQREEEVIRYLNNALIERSEPYEG
ncbi:MaoC family dehydratase [Natronomonas marina]|jgi:acyl dehydratase|uniref:MaoC family dehydratase n=1 Tax=Natronomonas marina TaxID=2961939 RepID=UPI0020C94DD4|nr:MaoC family dehydratase [Natronomonas marina]